MNGQVPSHIPKYLRQSPQKVYKFYRGGAYNFGEQVYIYNFYIDWSNLMRVGVQNIISFYGGLGKDI